MEIVPLPQEVLERIIPVMQRLFRVEFHIAEPSHQSAKSLSPTNLLTFCWATPWRGKEECGVDSLAPGSPETIAAVVSILLQLLIQLVVVTKGLLHFNIAHGKVAILKTEDFDFKKIKTFLLQVYFATKLKCSYNANSLWLMLNAFVTVLFSA